MLWLAAWYNRLSAFWRSAVQAIVMAASYCAASIGESILQDIFKNNQWNTGIVKLLVCVLIISSFLIIYTYLNHVSDQARSEDNARRSTLSYAASLMDQYTSKLIEQTDQLLNVHIKEVDKFKSSLVRLLSSEYGITDIVKKIYQLFESHYGQSEKIDDRIDFEVTFFASSYKDNELTIVAYGNRNGRQPTSMNIRQNSEPKLYQKTIAYSLCKEASPMMRLIPDTSAPSTGYIELYSGQKDRICSTIVFPVMSDRNKVLGVLVVHCNRKNFFQEGDRKFWNELLEIFAKRIALEKIRLDAIFDKERLGSSAPELCDVTLTLPF